MLAHMPPQAAMAPPARTLDGSQAPVQQYAMQHYDNFSNNNQMSPLRSPAQQRHHPYSQASTEIGHRRQSSELDDSKTTGTGVKRRISRACDQCNQLRTKCDGRSPCAHCMDFGLSCEYVRERKKRGKASRKDSAQQDQAANGSANSHSPQEYSSEGPSPHQVAHANGPALSHPPSAGHLGSHTNPVLGNPNASYQPRNDIGQNQTHSQNTANQPLHRLATVQDGILPDPNPQILMRQASGVSPTAMSLNGFTLGHDYERPGMRGPPSLAGMTPNQSGVPLNQIMQQQLQVQQGFQGFGENVYSAMSPANFQAASPGFRFGASGESPMAGYYGASPVVASPGWLGITAPANYQQGNRQINVNTLRYPVLQPLLPYIESIIPISLACDLLELYFTSSSTTHMHPISPHILGYVFRRESFLKQVRPRPCTPALLASMLWLAAQTSDSPFLTSPPSARARVCQKLLEITILLLKPLVHGPPAGENPANNNVDSVINGVALGGLGVAMTGGDQLTADGLGTHQLDNVATYMHLAVIVSASEYKAASMRWWNAAWTLAREMKLGKELPPNPVDAENSSGENMTVDGVAENSMPEQPPEKPGTRASLPPNIPGLVSEEEREERRRTWWLLYSVDRHLALCYNRPLFLLDVECDNLLQPQNDDDFHAGNFYGPDYRTTGPVFLCRDHSIFGYFTPLMAILGYIIDLNQARNHPRFGQTSHNAIEWDERADEITSLLEAYGRSLHEFEARNLPNSNDADNPHKSDASAPSMHPDGSVAGAAGPSRLTDSIVQTKIVVAYGTHIMHVLHILITGKWDPINLLDDNDLWISTPSFQNAMSHAVAAAEAISNILEYDPDLSYMPFFFGINLLQGGFLFLLTAEKLAGEANEKVVRACENIIKAHEACIVTLNTEYQRHMRKVMRSALAQVKGLGDQQLKRREVLALYRWTGDGTGLAL
ncbi:hypothetical protein MMC21_005364 [Puttea exsequens]|nr:hypothetical protein [Puttea exsequens]